MTQLMHDNVTRKVRRQKKQFGIEADSKRCRATPPPAALIAHLHTADAHLMPTCQLPTKGKQMSLAHTDKPTLQKQWAEPDLSGGKKTRSASPSA
jgi:hypothetical protein